MKAMNTSLAVAMGFSPDKRKRRNQHRTAAKQLLTGGGLFNGSSAPGTTFFTVAQWHKAQARAIK